MAIDIDDMLTASLDAVQAKLDEADTVMRTALADALTEVLDGIVEQVDGTESGEDAGYEDEAEQALWDEGFARAVELFREAIKPAKYAGIRPKLAAESTQ